MKRSIDKYAALIRHILFTRGTCVSDCLLLSQRNYVRFFVQDEAIPEAHTCLNLFVQNGNFTENNICS